MYSLVMVHHIQKVHLKSIIENFDSLKYGTFGNTRVLCEYPSSNLQIIIIYKTKVENNTNVW